ncbi:MAG TPA: transporter substrate-binding domain-containing protein [Methylomirabilota bacterium]|nr:transporter substrate-binding domain-containing protein [Methylomirabilota bacterium]
MTSASPAVRSDLAPSGTLRVGINHGNLVLAQKNPTTGEVKGVAVDMARELGRRLGVPVELVQFSSAGQMTDALAAGAWDVAFLAREPGRAGEIGFTAPHLLIEGTYLVPAGAPFTRVSDVDRAGVRIAVSEKSAYDHFLTRTIKHATLVRAPGNSAGLGLLQAGRADVIAGVRQLLLMDQAKLPGSTVLADRFMVIEQALGMPRGRAAGLAYAKAFIEELKASGFVARALEASGVRGVPVAPAEQL